MSTFISRRQIAKSLESLSPFLANKNSDRNDLIGRLNAKKGSVSNIYGAIWEVLICSAIAKLGGYFEIFVKLEDGKCVECVSGKILKSELTYVEVKSTSDDIGQQAKSIDKNRIISQLKSARNQLRAVPKDCKKCIFLVDAGSWMLANPSRFNARQTTLGNRVPLTGPYNTMQVVDYFLGKYDIDIVAMVVPYEVSAFPRNMYEWRMVVRVKDLSLEKVNDGFQKVLNNLPRPRNMPGARRNAVNNGFFDPKRISTLPEFSTRLKIGSADRKISISRNALISYMRGKSSYERFRSELGELAAKALDNWTEKGLSIADVAFISGELDYDDDLIELAFNLDPALQPFE